MRYISLFFSSFLSLPAQRKAWTGRAVRAISDYDVIVPLLLNAISCQAFAAALTLETIETRRQECSNRMG